MKNYPDYALELLCDKGFSQFVALISVIYTERLAYEFAESIVNELFGCRKYIDYNNFIVSRTIDK